MCLKEVSKIARKYLKWPDAPIWVKIGRNIYHTRKWKNLTQEQVASRAKVDIKRYKKMERTLIQDITHDETTRITNAMRLDDDEMIVAH